ncbi:MAG: hypothetical protein O3C43_04475 [Verrucomicrobia bacterium]|nr:hypothetical protein [Verrucomicrobiota bacterium]MDA1065739.1 hypothetical protein [Verrucomicrobiota bacterium]
MKKLSTVLILSALVIYAVLNVSKSKFIKPLTAQPAVDLNLENNSTLANQTSEITEIIFASKGMISSPERKDILREYWSTLLSEKSYKDTPSCRVDRILEFRHLVSLDVNEASEYLATLITMPEEYDEDIQIYASFLITQIASSDAEKAIELLTGSEFVYDDETYENALRLWMDKEGEGVLDWFERIENHELSRELAIPLFTVYAEEDPYGFLIRYGEREDVGYILQNSIRSLYDEYGNEVYESLLADNLPKKILEQSFLTIAQTKMYENPETARTWVLNNRFTVDGEVASKMAERILMEDNPWRAANLSKNLEWAMENHFLFPNNKNVKEHMRRLIYRDQNQAKEIIENLQLKFGPAMNELDELLLNHQEEGEGIFELSPFSIEADDQDYLASNTISGVSSNLNIKDLSKAINIVTKDFLESIN